MARQWIKERKDSSWLYSVTSLHQEGNFPISSIISGRPESHFIQKLRHLLLPCLPTSQKSTKYANHSPLLPAQQWKAPLQFSLKLRQGLLMSLSTMAMAAPPWQFKRCDKPVQTALYTKVVQCTFSPVHYDFFRIIFYSNASFPLLLFLEGTVYYVCLGLNIR